MKILLVIFDMCIIYSLGIGIGTILPMPMHERLSKEQRTAYLRKTRYHKQMARMNINESIESHRIATGKFVLCF
jgi:hypothetical protein